MANMTTPSDGVIEPIPISLISGRYLLFDIDTVTHLRRAHNICGVLMGTIPQIPQQNVFLGLPVELLPEEAKLLVEKEVAYVVDDARWHRDKFRSMVAGRDVAGVNDRTAYLASLRAQGRKARLSAEVIQAKRAEKGLAKQAVLRAKKEKEKSKTITSEEPVTAPNESSGVNATESEQSDDVSLFETHLPPRASSPSPSIASSMISSFTTKSSDAAYTLTPTTTYSHAKGPFPTTSLPYDSDKQSILVPASFPLFKHLQQKGYFLTPGLRFGCDYTVYPGDPLRFHSHFLAVGYGWEEEIPLIDLIGGGRLGTGVKKGFLVGGAVTGTEKREKEGPMAREEEVRTFCVEWGGM